MELPDLAGREAILKVHSKKILTEPDIDYRAIALATSGASGAELANIINEGALRAVRSGRTLVSQSDLEESVEVVIAGYQRKNAVISPKEREIVAYHEIGHALVAAKQSDSAPVHKITIIPRTSGALGYTMQVDEGEKFLMSREEAYSKLATLTAVSYTHLGAFLADCTMEEMIDFCLEATKDTGLYTDREEARCQMMDWFPTLKRWSK